MTKDWVHGVGHPPACKILLQIVVRAVITSSLQAWTVLLGCCRFQLTSPSSMIVLQPPLLCEGWGGHPLCLSGDSSVLMNLHWPMQLYSSEQYSVHRFSICRSSVRQFPERSWTVVDFPCFTVVKDTKSCRETSGTNTRNGQVRIEHPWTL